MTKCFDKRGFDLEREGKHFVWKHRIEGVKVVTAKTPSTKNFEKQVQKHIKQAFHYKENVLMKRAAQVGGKTERLMTIYKCKTNFHTNTPPPQIVSNFFHLTGELRDSVACGITLSNGYIYSVREKRKGNK